MKVLRVIWSMDPRGGGPSQGIRNSSPELSKLGVYTEVVSLDSPTADFLDTYGLTINPVGVGSGPWSYNAQLVPWLLNNLSRFDVVIVHGLWQYPSYAAFKAILKHRKTTGQVYPKFFVMPHGMLDPWFQKAKGRKLKAIRNWFFWKLVEGKVVNNCDGVLFTCEAELKLARQTFTPYKPKKEINVGYGIQAPPPYEDSMRESFLSRCPDVSSRRYILFLSRVNYKKGVDLLVDAYAHLRNKTQTTSDELPALVIAGPGLESKFGMQIKEKVDRDETLSKHIFFPGMLTGDSKWGAFYNADAFILPSHQENFGIAVAEALACGKPVMISDQVNIWTEIKEANAGIIGRDTVNGVIEMLEKWISTDSESRIQMAENARNVYTEKFEISSAAKHFLDGISNG